MDTPQHGSILPEGMNPEGLDIKKQAAHRYAAIHIEQPFDNPFSTIPGAYHNLHRFLNKAGEPYSAIYVGRDERLSCERGHEQGMIDYWNQG